MSRINKTSISNSRPEITTQNSINLTKHTDFHTHTCSIVLTCIQQGFPNILRIVYQFYKYMLKYALIECFSLKSNFDLSNND